MQAIKTIDLGNGYIASVYVDEYADYPWDREDGHVDVEYFNRDVPRGYTTLRTHGRGYYAFNTRAAILKASREGWSLDKNSREYARLGEKPSKSAIRWAAIEADARRMAEYLNGDWCYVGVSVHKGEDDFSHALWGIESDSDVIEVAQELLTQIEAEEQQRIAAVCC